jgi:hypothetical protein
MSKKFWLIIFIVAILVGILFGYFQDRFFTKAPSLERQEEKIERGKGFETIELEKPPFIK